MGAMPDWLPLPGWRDLVDIALVAAFLWLAIRYFRRTRARAALAGLGLLAVVYFVARGLELRLTEALLQAFFAVVVLVLVVVFQEDLRRLFEQLGTLRRGRARVSEELANLDVLVRTAAHLASARVGALFVLPGQEPLDRHIDGGVALGGRVSEPLLLSLFDASSPGHDGAVILRGSRVERFAVHLPLSSNHAALGPGGTRHAAALGLAERCDAICIVVSEERGTVSVAHEGAVRTLRRPEDLADALRSAIGGEAQARPWWKGQVGLDAALAAAGALALWFVFVPGSDVGEATVTASVRVTNLPGDLDLEAVEPDSVDVTLRGVRRDLLLAEPDRVSVGVDAYLARLGRRTFTISDQDVRRPGGLAVVDVQPEKVRLSVRPAEVAEPSDGS